ncbi:hypothetical protein L9F63_007676, partial [Diploptera punctata]
HSNIDSFTGLRKICLLDSYMDFDIYKMFSPFFRLQNHQLQKIEPEDFKLYSKQ